MAQLPASLVLSIAGVTSYAIAVYWTSRHPSWLTLVLALVPFVFIVAVWARKSFDPSLSAVRRIGALVPAALLLIALVIWWQPLLHNFRLLYLLEHVGVHAGLGLLFGRSLLRGHRPLCTEFASWVHDDMDSPLLIWYTRQVTVVWTVFFLAMALASLAIYGLGDPPTWTTFSAVVGPLLTGLVFVLENLARSLFLPPKDRVGLVGTWRAVRARLDDRAAAGER